jgi:hypothetical protein
MVDKRLDVNCARTQLLLRFSSKFQFTVDLCTNPVKVTRSPCAVFHGCSFCSVNGVEVTPELHARLSFFTTEVIPYVQHVQYKQITLLTMGVSCSPIFSHDSDCHHCTNISNNKCMCSIWICPVRCG